MRSGKEKKTYKHLYDVVVYAPICDDYYKIITIFLSRYFNNYAFHLRTSCNNTEENYNANL